MSAHPSSGACLQAPFLKVYNGTEDHQIKTTRDKPVGNTLSPEFWTSFEIAAMLPGQSQLHIEVWDYTLLAENLIGGTTIDLEDRFFSQQWQEMQRVSKLPRELRQLFNGGSTNAQGNVILRVEILPRQRAPRVELWAHRVSTATTPPSLACRLSRGAEFAAALRSGTA